MVEHNFGSLNSRQLCLRWSAPIQFSRWTDDGFRLSFARLFNPVRWWRAALDRWNWSFQISRHSEVTHRCYCPTGSLIDATISVFGFRLNAFYSHYTGELPCCCDKAVQEMYAEDESEEVG